MVVYSSTAASARLHVGLALLAAVPCVVTTRKSVHRMRCMATTMSGRRASALSPPEFFLLEEWGKSLRRCFGKPPYLVGSCERGAEFRDVDVVLMLADEDYASLMGPEPRRIAALNLSVSMWGQRATGLPIDFRFQDTTNANAEYGGQTRNPLGLRDGWEFTGQRSESAANALPAASTPNEQA